MLNETYKLNNGVEVPKLGLGTWMMNNEEVAQAICDAVKIGYRHFDSAEGYENEVGVGEGIKKCGIPRSELFITTKIDAFAKTYESAKEKLEGSLKDLDLDYIDLVIIHAPQPWTNFKDGNHYFKENIEVWKVLEEYYESGKVRAIGLSNFEISDVKNIIDHSHIKPMVNQVLAHISNVPKELIQYCQENDILVEAYSPIGHGEVLKNEKIKEIADKYNVSVSALCIRYCLQLGLLPLPKTTNPVHMKDNVSVDFEISKEDMEVLNNIEQIKNYGESSIFPVYGGKMITPDKYEARDYKELNHE